MTPYSTALINMGIIHQEHSAHATILHKTHWNGGIFSTLWCSFRRRNCSDCASMGSSACFILRRTKYLLLHLEVWWGYPYIHHSVPMRIFWGFCLWKRCVTICDFDPFLSIAPQLGNRQPNPNKSSTLWYNGAGAASGCWREGLPRREHLSPLPGVSPSSLYRATQVVPAKQLEQIQAAPCQEIRLRRSYSRGLCLRQPSQLASEMSQPWACR